MVRAVGDATVVDDAESVPLSPHAPARVAMAAPARSDRFSETRPVAQTAPKQGGGAAPAARSAVLEAPRLGATAERVDDKAQRANLFDAVWPIESKGGTPLQVRGVGGHAPDAGSKVIGFGTSVTVCFGQGR